MAAKKIFVNLPVKNLDKSKDFFAKLGFTFNVQFTDATAACMVVSEDIYVMLLTQSKFKTFTPGEICDTARNTEVLVCLSAESRKEVDENGSQGARGWRNNFQRAARLRLYVRPRIPGPRWPYLGTGLYGAQRH